MVHRDPLRPLPAEYDMPVPGGMDVKVVENVRRPEGDVMSQLFEHPQDEEDVETPLRH